MTRDRFSGKVVLVTGARRGIGKNIARAFAREGAAAVVADIDEPSGRAARDELRAQGLTAEFVNVDLRKKGMAQGVVREVVEKLGRLDVLVNNARSGRRTDLFDESEETWEDTISVALRAAFFASQEAIRSMAKTGGGSIINIGSIAATMATHESPIYHIAKAGMVQMTRYLAAQGGAHGVRVNAVLPGFIVQDEHRARYEAADNQRYREIAEFCHPGGRVGSAEDVAQTVLFLCSPEASFISGQYLLVDGGATLREQFGLLYEFAESRRWTTEA